jgi:hypothetical protein
MSEENHRRSDRAIPFVSDEEVVVVHQDGQANVLAKIMDLSDVGTLVYLLGEGEPTGSIELSIYHQGKVFKMPATVIRKNGRLVALDFVNPTPESSHEIQSKLIRMEVEWMRLSRRG